MNEFATLVPLPRGLGEGKSDHLDRSTYTELMRLARTYLGRNGTMWLDAPSLVHEAYMRATKQGIVASAQRNIFLAMHHK